MFDGDLARAPFLEREIKTVEHYLRKSIAPLLSPFFFYQSKVGSRSCDVHNMKHYVELNSVTPAHTLTGLAPHSCIFISASSGVMLQLIKKAIRVSVTKQLNALGLHRFSALSSQQKHCNATKRR